MSKNKAPSRDGGTLKLPPNYDFNEQKRVWIETNSLFGEAESNWADIVNHLDDNRYCLTMKNNSSGISSEWSVSDVCAEIVGRNLTEGYYRSLKPDSLKPETFDRFRNRRGLHFLKDAGQLKEWCQQRKDKKLYELQAELCEMMVKAIEKNNQLQNALGAAEVKSCLEMLRGAAATLKQSKMSIRCEGFGPDEFSPLIKLTEAAPSPGPKP